MMRRSKVWHLWQKGQSAGQPVHMATETPRMVAAENSQVFYQQNEFIWIQERIAIRDKRTIAKTIGKFSKQRRETSHYRQNEKVGMRALNKRPSEEAEIQGGDGFLLSDLQWFPLAGFVAG